MQRTRCPLSDIFGLTMTETEEIAMIADLERRVLKLEAAADIRHLKRVYATACDNGYLPDVIAPMFTEDAVWDGGGEWGRHEGREAIHRFFSQVTGGIAYATHFMIGGDIEVADDVQTASGTWQLWQPLSVMSEGELRSAVMAGTYSDTYRFTDEGWKFSSLKVDWDMQARLDKGWATDQFQM